MTIVIAFHQSGYRDFKTYYIHFNCLYLTNKFSELTSDLYKRDFFKLNQSAFINMRLKMVTDKEITLAQARINYRSKKCLGFK
ncbi:hypothetical protein [Candidatus Enterovibrio escicola]|uniref:hypothetical protein n=1 Tax=Candidatus Enterovibrio escicola TaxID=1927127 RepID=UPI00168175A5